MRSIFTLLLFFASTVIFAQKQERAVQERMKQFHEDMVAQWKSIGDYLDDSLSYGHSNGWIEDKKDFLNNLGTRITYHSFKEDSIRTAVNGKIAHVRFVADVDVSLDGKRNTYRLRILEVWVKEGQFWKLFARQAIRG